MDLLAASCMVCRRKVDAESIRGEIFNQTMYNKTFFLLFYVLHTQLCKTLTKAEEMLSFHIELDHYNAYVRFSL